MKPKVLIKASILALSVLCLSQAVNVSAQDRLSLTTSKIEFNQASTYTVSLTKRVQLSDDKTSQYTVHVDGDIASEDELLVKPKDDMPDRAGVNCVLRDSTENANDKKDDVIATVRQDKVRWNHTNINEDAIGIINAENLSAGDWLGLVNFNISIVPRGKMGVAEELANWNYTLDNNEKTVTLNYYIGNETDVVIHPTYKVNDEVYRTVIASNNSANTEESYYGQIFPYMFNNTPYLIDESNTYKGISNIKTITFEPGIDTSNVTDVRFMFAYCKSLTTLDVSNFDTSNVTDMTCIFTNCNSLTTLDVSNFDTSNVTNMESMFLSCTSLTSLDVSNFDTSNVTDMNGMFAYCSSLTSLDVSNFDTSNVTDMNGMFAYCSSLTTLDVSNFDTSNVTDMNGIFAYCSALTSLDLSNFDTRNVTAMASMFSDCSSLITLDLSNFNTGKVTNMNGMFYNCSSLTTLDLSNFDTSNVTNMASMFNRCSSLITLDLSNFNTGKVTNMNGIFYNCSSLTTLDLSNFDTSNVINMEALFYGCSTLKTLALSNFDTSNVTNMKGMFYNCCKLQTILIGPNWNTNAVTNSTSMFKYSSKLPNYSSNYVDKTRAYAGGNGYLTLKQ